MGRKSELPTITKEGFDAIEPELRAALKDWCEDETADFDASIEGTASVWDGMPDIDSKAVVKASPIVRQFTGADLNPKMIRKGGYSSFEDLAGDLLPKLRDACPLALPDHPPVGAATLESVDVRRS